MKLERFKKRNNKVIGVLLFTIICILLIGSVILYKTFASFEVNHHFNIINGEIENSGDIYFAFYVDNTIQKEMPHKEEGYMLDDKQSFCGINGDRDPSIIPSLDRDTWSIVVTGMTSSRTKCNLYFKKTYDDQTLYDLSGNGYNGTFMEGTKIQADEDGNLGIYFDGIDDYVQVAELPETIDWANGFTVETEFKAISLSGWNRIYDFGNGRNSNNLLFVVGRDTFDLEISIRYDSSISFFARPHFLNENEKFKIKATFEKLNNGYVVRVYKNDIFVDSEIFETTNLAKNIPRTSNYLGKSNWMEEAMYHFFGYIYSLKFTDSNGEVFLWYDF